jgi:hypothetical protein
LNAIERYFPSALAIELAEISFPIKPIRFNAFPGGAIGSYTMRLPQSRRSAVGP